MNLAAALDIDFNRGGILHSAGEEGGKIMWIFLLGLTGFLVLHSLRVVAPDWRQRWIVHWGERRWKAVYSLLAIVFFVSMIWGYGQARQEPYWLWTPPPTLRHPAYALIALAFILLTAAY